MPRERMSERAFRHAREAFGIERMVECTSEAYRDAYARASGRRISLAESVTSPWCSDRIERSGLPSPQTRPIARLPASVG